MDARLLCAPIRQTPSPLITDFNAQYKYIGNEEVEAFSLVG
jgi:hypothetical protein